jgi:PAS domain-containing protein
MIPKLYSVAALTEPLDLFGQLLAQAPFAVWIADRDGKIVMFNEAMKNLVEIEDPERILESYNIFKDPVAVSQGLIPHLKKVLGGRVIQTVLMLDLSLEHFNYNGAPKVLYLRCLYYPLKNEHGDFEYVAVLVENIAQEYLDDLMLTRKSHETEEAHREIVDLENKMIAAKERIARLEKQLAGLKKRKV